MQQFKGYNWNGRKRDEGWLVIWKDKVRTLSPMKDKGENIESYGNIKARTLSPMKA